MSYSSHGPPCSRTTLLDAGRVEQGGQNVGELEVRPARSTRRPCGLALSDGGSWRSVVLGAPV
ncbi:hypothetical protein [Nonomuraea aridisoli]|uniref:hypothetical protein n=1 Tax=Nonomuraea aridisoli TaxID=2070368 RepID=UPI0015E8E903|nr:hypothetical protein [Nonomuraea aridisoli]